MLPIENLFPFNLGLSLLFLASYGLSSFARETKWDSLYAAYLRGGT